MNIKINRIRPEVLENIIREFGELSIGRCRPYLDYCILFFDISITGYCELLANDNEVIISKEGKRVTINRSDFFSITLL